MSNIKCLGDTYICLGDFFIIWEDFGRKNNHLGGKLIVK